MKRTAVCLDCWKRVEVKFDSTAREWAYVSHASNVWPICRGSYHRVVGRIEETPDETPAEASR